MKKFIVLSSQDRRELLITCFVGIQLGVLVTAIGWKVLAQAGEASLQQIGLLLLAGGLIGGSTGLLIFLHRRLLTPLRQIIRSLPRRATQKVAIRGDIGIAPLRLLSHRVNTLLAQLQKRLDQNQKDVSDLAHDLRGPLTRLMIRIEALRSEIPPDAELIAGLEADLKSMLALNRDLDEASQSEERTLHMEWTPLEPFCLEISASYGIGVVSVAIDPSIALWADRRMLQRTVHNLIDNALEYGGAPVKISASAANNELVINVEDTGRTGLRPFSIPQPIPFTHHGVGLMLARGFCISHGGYLELDSSPLGGWRVSLVVHSVPLTDACP